MSTFIETTHITQQTPRNGWQLFRLLVSGQWMPGSAWQNRRYRQKFLLRSLATPVTTAKLLTSLAQQPYLEALLRAHPGLPCRMHRPYLSANTGRHDAQAALDFHYKQLNRLLPAPLLQSQWSKQGACIAQITGKNGEQYQVQLAALSMLDKEGESTLVFCDENGTTLAEMTFTLCQRNGETTLFIGGLQGAKNWVPHEDIQLATKACHGLFPKRLLLETACLIAPLLQASQIQAVGNETHIYRNWRYAKKKKDKLHADYDSFWLSMGGEQDNDGNFTLPAVVARKPMEEIASKKRAEYRRRYELLDSLTSQVIASIKAG